MWKSHKYSIAILVAIIGAIFTINTYGTEGLLKGNLKDTLQAYFEKLEPIEEYEPSILTENSTQEAEPNDQEDTEEEHSDEVAQNFLD